MSLVISKVFTYDTDAGNYIQAVEAADTVALEPAVRQAINNFVVGCKQDGIWSAIKASCILAGARTRAGAMVPLANASGIAPTLNGTAGGWNYDRKLGLKGNATDNYINSGRNNNADPQDSSHQAVYISNAGTVASMFLIGAGVTNTGSTSLAKISPSNLIARNRNGADGGSFGSSANTTGFFGASRSISTAQIVRANSASTSQALASQSPFAGNVFVFGSNSGSSLSLPTDSRLTFYSIGESLDLQKLDSRVTDLMAAFNNPLVIP